MSRVNIEKEKCVHCGACTAVCNEGALFMKRDEWTLAFDESICTNCSACIKACPLRAIKHQA